MPKGKVTRKNSGKKACQAEVFDTDGKVVEKMDLPERIFAAKVNEKLMAQAVRVYLANQRQGTQKTKTRGEVRKSTAKIWRQKGTGRARHGARSAPIFVGGGVAHGPRPRDFSLKIPQKMRRAALFASLSHKFQEKEIVVLKGLEEIQPKTKEFVGVLKKLESILDRTSKKKLNLLVVLPGKIENLQRAARNVEGVTLSPAAGLNTYSVLNHRKLLFLKTAFPVLEQTFLKKELAPDVVEKAKTTKKPVGSVKD
ncbi:MAG: 50S ribosomal protein L4 [bacterium]|nr:50S ribosomal protein L4 [bacterium]